MINWLIEVKNVTDGESINGQSEMGTNTPKYIWFKNTFYIKCFNYIWAI